MLHDELFDLVGLWLNLNNINKSEIKIQIYSLNYGCRLPRLHNLLQAQLIKYQMLVLNLT